MKFMEHTLLQRVVYRMTISWHAVLKCTAVMKFVWCTLLRRVVIFVVMFPIICTSILIYINSVVPNKVASKNILLKLLLYKFGSIQIVWINSTYARKAPMNLAELETSLRLAVAQEYPLYATVVLIPSLRGIDSLAISKVSTAVCPNP